LGRALVLELVLEPEPALVLVLEPVLGQHSRQLSNHPAVPPP
jgi:hypothetical protein